MANLSEILKDNKFTPEDLPEFESKLFFEGDRTQRHLVQFIALLLLSTIIAAVGVIEDSTATVIGAMIIAPLMTPIVATTAALMMGNGLRAFNSFLLVVVSVLGVILVSAVIGMMSTHVIDFQTNSQITARVAPRFLDLIVALAAGAAGAFAISRDDISDSIPGVAISISLVPPLCVVGISLSSGQFSDALGALLLFLTNYLSILLSGGAVFALLGLGAAVARDMSHLNKRKVYRRIALGVILVAIPLTATSIKVARDSIAQVRITKISNQWVSQYSTNFILRSVLVSGDTAKILISGDEKPATIKGLGEAIQTEVKQIKEVDLRFVRSSSYQYP
ncbi:MAG: TIGR00341 family protein [Arenicellales bacterium]